MPMIPAELVFLHDCAVLAVTYSGFTGSGRRIRLDLRCPPDTGHSALNGVDVQVEAIDVSASRHIVWGIGSPDSLDAIREGVSNDWKRQIPFIPPGAAEVTIVFSSGSLMELICTAVELTI